MFVSGRESLWRSGGRISPDSCERVDCEIRHLDCLSGIFNFSCGRRGLQPPHPSPWVPLNFEPALFFIAMRTVGSRGLISGTAAGNRAYAYRRGKLFLNKEHQDCRMACQK